MQTTIEKKEFCVSYGCNNKLNHKYYETRGNYCMQCNTKASTKNKRIIETHKKLSHTYRNKRNETQ